MRGAWSTSLVFSFGLATGLAVAGVYPFGPWPRPMPPLTAQAAAPQDADADAQQTDPEAAASTALDPAEIERTVGSTAFAPIADSPDTGTDVREPAAAEPGPALTPAQVARAARAATVFLHGRAAYGAGILVGGGQYVLTCLHVVQDRAPLRAQLADGRQAQVSVVDQDARLDIALLRIRPAGQATATTGSIVGVQTGDELYAMGAPRKMAFSFARGMASFVGRPFDGVFYLQSDVALNGGSSGGPVLDRRGRVIAISSFVLKDSEGLAFALPLDYAYARFAAHLGPLPAPEGTAEDTFEDWLSSRANASQ